MLGNLVGMRSIINKGDCIMDHVVLVCNNKKCKYEFGALIGMGYFYPTDYMKTKEKMISGELGIDAKKFFEEHPNGVINAEGTIKKCPECNELYALPDLSMYLRKNTLSDKENQFPNPMDFKEHLEPEEPYFEYINKALGTTATDNELDEETCEPEYELYKLYDHRCKKCNKHLEVVKSKELWHSLLKCPLCGDNLHQDFSDTNIYD